MLPLMFMHIYQLGKKEKGKKKKKSKRGSKKDRISQKRRERLRGSNKSAKKGGVLKSSLIVMQLRSSANLYTVIRVISHLHRDERAYFIENLVSPLVTLMKADYCTQCNL